MYTNKLFPTPPFSHLFLSCIHNNQTLHFCPSTHSLQGTLHPSQLDIYPPPLCKNRRLTKHALTPLKPKPPNPPARKKNPVDVVVCCGMEMSCLGTERRWQGKGGGCGLYGRYCSGWVLRRGGGRRFMLKWCCCCVDSLIIFLVSVVHVHPSSICNETEKTELKKMNGWIVRSVCEERKWLEGATNKQTSVCSWGMAVTGVFF